MSSETAKRFEDLANLYAAVKKKVDRLTSEDRGWSELLEPLDMVVTGCNDLLKNTQMNTEIRVALEMLLKNTNSLAREISATIQSVLYPPKIILLTQKEKDDMAELKKTDKEVCDILYGDKEKQTESELQKLRNKCKSKKNRINIQHRETREAISKRFGELLDKLTELYAKLKRESRQK